MDILMVTLRAVHVLTGVFWAGTLIFLAFFLGPAVQDTGPDGGKVVVALVKRGFMTFLPIMAILTVVTGLWMYMKLGGGDPGAFGRSPFGMTLGVGGLLAIVALAIGLGILRPSQLKAIRLGGEAMQMPEGAERDATMATVMQLRMRAAGAGRLVAILLIVTTLTMGVARYLR